jgi:hypothetical protein
VFKQKTAQQAHAPDLLLLYFSKLVCWQKHILLGRTLPTRKRVMRGGMLLELMRRFILHQGKLIRHL